jgi:hypothetical protein
MPAAVLQASAHAARLMFDAAKRRSLHASTLSLDAVSRRHSMRNKRGVKSSCFAMRSNDDSHRTLAFFDDLRCGSSHTLRYARITSESRSPRPAEVPCKIACALRIRCRSLAFDALHFHNILCLQNRPAQPIARDDKRPTCRETTLSGLPATQRIEQRA